MVTEFSLQTWMIFSYVEHKTYFYNFLKRLYLFFFFLWKWSPKNQNPQTTTTKQKTDIILNLFCVLQKKKIKDMRVSE